jgi:hypothetical protein
MRVDRWFNVLVLGGAAIVGACKSGDAEDAGTREAGDGGTSATSAGGAGVSSSAAAGLSSNAGTGGASEAGASPLGGGAGAVGVDGGSGGNSGSAPVGAGASSGGVDGTADSSDSGAGGGAGSEAQLTCRVDTMGFGSSKDPCGCPCCWARDCLNTDTICCGGFCKGADAGRGCCGQ